ncbi:UpxY family transcription antiterminator [Gillisia sp. M10.2A]|uniref:UpxY family transcription antiterminator n=1 Tax=Gillisia lutea TaxID=2909668 RepID=A0ABS9EH01_9FLAO|nr:UpxY family transcription antiterminator [Gillisia lutea]MCF4102162.1 UpxY family transcription antiterminator [Gillisia lutea]
MSWYVLYTKPRAEKRVAKNLESAKIEIYCPIVTEVRQWSDRKKKVEVPLFTSYVFVKLKDKERQKVFEFPDVIRYLYWLGKPAVVRDHEIETIKNWLDTDNYDDFVIKNLSPGDRVKITSGALKDQDGIIRHIGTKRLSLVLTEAGCTVSVKLKEVV